MYYFYILKGNKKNWHYFGSTKDLIKRINDHQKGKVKSTAPYLPIKLIYYEAYLLKSQAARREISVKKSASSKTAILERIKGA